MSLVAIVCSWQFSGNARQRPQLVSVAIREVEGELREDGRRCRKRLAGRGGEKVETRTVIETDVKMKLRTILIRIHHVARAHGGTTEPADVSRRAMPRDNGDPGFLI